MRAAVIQRRLLNEQNNLEELKSLAESAGYEVSLSLEQIRNSDPKFQIGKGKAEELKELVKELHIEKVIFDNPMKPIQSYNLAKVTGIEVIDRFQLILEIFSLGAKNSEAKLQINLAKLRYELPRAKEKVKLARMTEQPGFHGLGKYEVDIYYETIRRQIGNIRSRLKKKGKKRRLHRAYRLKLGFSLISLAGYTSSGKSTLFNVLAEESVPVDPNLFTTLSTTTRAIGLYGKKTLLTDTVGFIDRLPLTLINAFHSTLEETSYSNLILLVVDISEQEREIKRKISCSLDTIKDIEAEGIPIVTALNKIDLLSEKEVELRVSALEGLALNPVPISALDETNIILLKERLLIHLTSQVEAILSLNLTDEAMSLVSWLFNETEVQNIEYKEDWMEATIKTNLSFAEKVRDRVEQLGGVYKAKTDQSLSLLS